MPEFVAEHIPTFKREPMLASEGFEDFLRGYFAAAEWLLPEEIDRTRIHGWSRDTRIVMIADCRMFWRYNATDLREYIAQRSAENAGSDFFLTRERHGAGFWDRGLGDVGKRLTKAAHSYGEFGYPYLHRGWICA